MAPKTQSQIKGLVETFVEARYFPGQLPEGWEGLTINDLREDGQPLTTIGKQRFSRSLVAFLKALTTTIPSPYRLLKDGAKTLGVLIQEVTDSQL